MPQRLVKRYMYEGYYLPAPFYKKGNISACQTEEYWSEYDKQCKKDGDDIMRWTTSLALIFGLGMPIAIGVLGFLGLLPK